MPRPSSVLLTDHVWTPCDILSEIKNKESTDMGTVIISYNTDLQNTVKNA